MEAEKKAFKITKREIGFVLGIVVFLLVKFLPLAELSSTVELTVGGQTCLALTLATVVFWACGVAQPGFVGLLYCALLVLFKVCVDDTGAASISATVASTFSSWTKATMWLVIGAYLIASAVKESAWASASPMLLCSSLCATPSRSSSRSSRSPLCCRC